MLINLLEALELTEEEVKIYTSLLEFGPITVGNLAKKIGKPRPSLYGLLKHLQEKGIIIQSSKLGTKIFLAEQPAKISLLFRQKIEDLENKEKLYKNLISGLEDIMSPKLLTPKFQLYEDKASLRHIMKDILLYRDIECQTLWPIKAMIEILSPDFFRYFNKERIKNNIYTRSIWPASQTVNMKEHPYLGVGEEFKREIRIAPSNINFSMGYILYKNKAAFISSQKESFGFIIESKELVEMLLSQFEIIWKLSKSIIVKPEDANSFLQELKNNK